MFYVSEGDKVRAVFPHTLQDNPNREIEATVTKVEQRWGSYNEGRNKSSPLLHVTNVMNTKGQILSGPMHHAFDMSFVTEIIQRGNPVFHKYYNIYMPENQLWGNDHVTCNSKNQVTGTFRGLLCVYLAKLSQRNINRSLDLKRAWLTWQKDCYRGLKTIYCPLGPNLIGSIFTVNVKTFKKWVFKNVERILERSKDIERGMTEYNNKCEKDYWDEVDKEYAAEAMEEAGVADDDFEHIEHDFHMEQLDGYYD
jgi:hypothetical protein